MTDREGVPVTPQAPFVWRMFGYTLTDMRGGRRRIRSVAVMAFLLATAGICLTGSAIMPRVVGCILSAIAVGVLAAVFRSLMERHVPVLPCPCCGGTPVENRSRLLGWAGLMMLRHADASMPPEPYSDAEVEALRSMEYYDDDWGAEFDCLRRCGTVPRTKDRFEWNRNCMKANTERKDDNG